MLLWWLRMLPVESRRAFPRPSTTLMLKAQEFRAMRVTSNATMIDRLLSAPKSTVLKQYPAWLASVRAQRGGACGQCSRATKLPCLPVQRQTCGDKMHELFSAKETNLLFLQRESAVLCSFLYIHCVHETCFQAILTFPCRIARRCIFQGH